MTLFFNLTICGIVQQIANFKQTNIEHMFDDFENWFYTEFILK